MSRALRFYIFLSILFAATALIILGIEVFGFQKISNMASNLSEENLRLSKMSEKQESLEELAKKYQKVESDLPKINTALPDQKDVSRLLSDLDTLATESGLKLTLLESSTAGKKQTQSTDPNLLQTIKGKNSLELPLEIKVEGGFVGLSIFIKRLENYQRLVNITSMEITKPTNTADLTDKIEAKIKMLAFLKR